VQSYQQPPTLATEAVPMGVHLEVSKEVPLAQGVAVVNRLETHFLKTQSTGEQGGGTPVVLQLYQMQLNVPDDHEAARMVVYLALSEELQSAQELVVGQRLETHLSTRHATVEQRVSTLMT